MTNEKTREVLQEQIDRYGQEYDAEGIEALETAIKALERQDYDNQGYYRLLNYNDDEKVALQRHIGLLKSRADWMCNTDSLTELVNYYYFAKKELDDIFVLVFDKIDRVSDVPKKPTGEWILIPKDDIHTYDSYRCSNCERFALINEQTDFCPYCGSDMRGDRI